jgi:hypothetical protein
LAHFFPKEREEQGWRRETIDEATMLAKRRQESRTARASRSFVQRGDGRHRGQQIAAAFGAVKRRDRHEITTGHRAARRGRLLLVRV